MMIVEESVLIFVQSEKSFNAESRANHTRMLIQAGYDYESG